ncbi:MAG: Crp/Fnr family transcriptional regulator [Prolixibacteraceae bacterium]|jgi:CRP/FNR family transcriptional regulator|nr:Crp/Fnr family transcriptional regulator [Prolixibacteraceae bacterium]MDD4754626.1 Crp/Fnr family transcriptional regulator [Prolixibacteraceae bacterium]
MKNNDKEKTINHQNPEWWMQQLQVDFSELIKNKTQITYLKGETIFKQGAFAPYIIFIVRGLVKVYLQTGFEKQINISLAKSGDFLAFSSVFGEKIHTYSAQALKDSLICMIEKESLTEVLLQNPGFALDVTSKNYRNERHLLELIRNISYKQMRGKLASALLYLSQEEYLKEDVFEFLTRQEIADFASISTESAIKFLKEFEKEEILQLDGRCIVITNRSKLEIISKTS